MRTPPPSSVNARNTMRATRSVSRLEQRFRRDLSAEGVRGYRVTMSALPGRPDLAFPGQRLAVFVHGCFWHSCPSCDLPRPRANAAFWAEKLRSNVERDARVRDALGDRGWQVLVVWEHEVRDDPDGAVCRLIDARNGLRAARQGSHTSTRPRRRR